MVIRIDVIKPYRNMSLEIDEYDSKQFDLHIDFNDDSGIIISGLTHDDLINIKHDLAKL